MKLTHTFIDQLNEYNRYTTHQTWYQKTIRTKLNYTPPYLWDDLIDYLSKREIPGVEYIVHHCYYRTVLIHDSNSEISFKGWLKVENHPEDDSLCVDISASLFPVWSEVIHKLRHLFDINLNPSVISQYLGHDWTVNGLRVPGAFDGFELSVRAILGQQITVKAATTLCGRLVNHLGSSFNPGIEGLSKLFPIPETFVALSQTDVPIADILGPLGITGRRSETIASLAQAVTAHKVHLEPIVSGITSINQNAFPVVIQQQVDLAEAEMKQLLNIKGIGKWTAQYIGMRALGYPDSFLETDIGIKRAMPEHPTPKDRLNTAEQWRPLRSYANVNLYFTIKTRDA